MIRSGLTFVLIALQLLSWSSQPLYLCLGSDGSIDLCLGPGHCDCERSHHDAHHDTDDACCQCHHGADEHLAALVRTPLTTDCDCTHLQITRAIAPTVIGKAITPDNQELAVAAIPSGDLLANLQARAADFNQLGNSLCGGDASPLAHLSTVALRC